MNALVYVEIQITDGREPLLDSIFTRHIKAVSTWRGFVALRRLRDVERRSGTFCLLLEFRNAESLNRWRASEEHRALASAYASCCKKPPVARIFYENN